MDDAIRLVLDTAKLAKGGEIFVLKMPAIKIGDLAKVMIEKLAPKYNRKPEDVKLEIVGARAGERINECLMTEKEMLNSKETDEMFVILPTLQLPHLKDRGDIYIEGKPIKAGNYSSGNAKLLNKKEIENLISEKRQTA